MYVCYVTPTKTNLITIVKKTFVANIGHSAHLKSDCSHAVDIIPTKMRIYYC